MRLGRALATFGTDFTAENVACAGDFESEYTGEMMFIINPSVTIDDYSLEF